MYTGKLKATVFIAVMTVLIEEIATKRVNQRTVGTVISGDQQRNLLRNQGRYYKSSYNAPMRKKKALMERRRMLRSVNSIRGRTAEESYGKDNRSQRNHVPPQPSVKFAGRVPASEKARSKRWALNRNRSPAAPSSGKYLLRLKGRQQTIDSRNNLPPVSFAEFNYNHLIKRPGSCARNADIDDSADADDDLQTVAVSSSTPPPPPDPNIPLEARHKEAIIGVHNEYRSNIEPQAADMRLLSWDDELEWISQTFTNSCYIRDLLETDNLHQNGSQAHPKAQLRRHSYYTTEIGHAWFAWPQTYDIPSDFSTTAFQAWESEKRFFNRDSKECDALCEHYLQVFPYQFCMSQQPVGYRLDRSL